jgi:hypothetical protein
MALPYKSVKPLIWLLLIMSGLLNACRIENVYDFTCPVRKVNSHLSEVHGKWILIQGITFGQGTNIPDEDYSCHRITYEFRRNGTLIVNSNLTDYIGLPSGTFTFEWEAQETLDERQLYTLKIGGDEFGAMMREGELEIDFFPRGGPTGPTRPTRPVSRLFRSH